VYFFFLKLQYFHTLDIQCRTNFLFTYFNKFCEIEWVCLGSILFLIIFYKHVWVGFLNSNFNQVLSIFTQFCLGFFKPSKHNFKKQILLVFAILNIVKNDII
jgi:hypothetical protein